MKKIVFILFLTILGSQLAAQNVVKFNKIYSIYPGIPANASSIVLSTDGYVIYSETSDSISPYPLRMSIQKIDTIGNLLWSKSYGKTGLQYWATYSDGGGGVWVPWGGYAGTGWITNDSDTWSDAALFRFDSKGDTVWTKRYNDSAQIVCTKLKVTRDKKYIIGGFWLGASSFNTVTLIKTDSVGKKLWQKNYYSGLSRVIYGMDTTSDGGFILSVDNNYVGCSDQLQVIKTDSLGNVQWTQTLSDPICSDGVFGIISLKNGEYALTGSYATSSSPPYYADMYIAKLSGNGSVKWAKQYSYSSSPWGAGLFMLRELPNGDLITAGDGDDTNSNSWGIIMKVDSNGNKLWLRSYSMQQPEQDYLNDIRPTPDGGFVACGFTYGNTESIWVVKTDSLGCDTVECNYATGVGEVKSEREEVGVYPNPSNGIFTLALSHPELVSGTQTIEIYDVLGARVYSQFNIHNSQFTINLSNQPNGIYMYRVIAESGELIEEGKIIVER